MYRQNYTSGFWYNNLSHIIVSARETRRLIGADLELLARDDLLEFLTKLLADVEGVVLVQNERKCIDLQQMCAYIYSLRAYPHKAYPHAIHNTRTHWNQKQIQTKKINRTPNKTERARKQMRLVTYCCTKQNPRQNIEYIKAWMMLIVFSYVQSHISMHMHVLMCMCEHLAEPREETYVITIDSHIKLD